MKLKDEFEFHHKDEEDFIYKATKSGEDKFRIEWGEGKNRSHSYSDYSHMVTLIEKGIWIIIGKEEVNSPVEIITIGGYNHYFAKLENGEVLVFRAFDQTQHTSYTTITQQDFDSIKKIVDLT